MSVNAPHPDQVSPIKPGFFSMVLTGAAIGVLGAALRREYLLPHPLDNTNQQIAPDFFLLVVGLASGTAFGLGIYTVLTVLRRRRFKD